MGVILRPVADVVLERGEFRVEIPMLMGRMDIFDKFRIIFDEKKGWIDFEE
ncbi:MAG: hypothetical protein PVH61_38040 [Candidatus Aminicenantes bacterium]|jgi:hypothetical protein